MKKIRVNKNYVILISMVLAYILLPVLFTVIFKSLLEMSTWNSIKYIFELFHQLII